MGRLPRRGPAGGVSMRDPYRFSAWRRPRARRNQEGVPQARQAISIPTRTRTRRRRPSSPRSTRPTRSLATRRSASSSTAARSTPRASRASRASKASAPAGRRRRLRARGRPRRGRVRVQLRWRRAQRRGGGAGGGSFEDILSEMFGAASAARPGPVHEAPPRGGRHPGERPRAVRSLGARRQGARRPARPHARRHASRPASPRARRSV